MARSSRSDIRKPAIVQACTGQRWLERWKNDPGRRWKLLGGERYPGPLAGVFRFWDPNTRVVLDIVTDHVLVRPLESLEDEQTWARIPFEGVVSFLAGIQQLRVPEAAGDDSGQRTEVLRFSVERPGFRAWQNDPDSDSCDFDGRAVKGPPDGVARFVNVAAQVVVDVLPGVVIEKPLFNINDPREWKWREFPDYVRAHGAAE